MAVSVIPECAKIAERLFRRYLGENLLFDVVNLGTYLLVMLYDGDPPASSVIKEIGETVEKSYNLNQS